jgi:amino acid transporter
VRVPDQPHQQPAGQRFGLGDTVSIIVGIVVGTAIFRSPPLVFQNVASAWGALGVWLLGGGLCLCGAFCYAELATTYPRNGGDYEYLTRAFGRGVGFLFGWAQLTAILTGSIAAMGYAFADYAGQLWPLTPGGKAGLAAGVVTLLSLANAVGVGVGKSLQNLLSGAKVLGLALVVIVGLGWGEQPLFASAETLPIAGPGLGLALVFVLYAYGGWNAAAFVAAEVRNQQRNLPRALLLGIGGITLLYLAVNLAYLKTLGFAAAREATTPAAAVAQQVLGDWSAKAISVLVMVSALGAINGMILAGAQIFATMGEDFWLFAWLGRRTRQTAAPAAAVLLQGAIAVLLTVAVGTETGRTSIDLVLKAGGLSGLPWDKYFGGFETLVAGTAPVFWIFFLLTGVALFVLRSKDPDRARPFSVPWYPLPPLVFCATCGYMLYSSLEYAKLLTLLGLVPVILGIPVFLFGTTKVSS